MKKKEFETRKKIIQKKDTEETIEFIDSLDKQMEKDRIAFTKKFPEPYRSRMLKGYKK